MNVHVIDTFQLGRPHIVAATALETNDGVVLFDTGPESTFKNVTGALEKLGFKTADVRHVFLSHIHFDHAGAAFRFAQAGATIYVHPRGAPHLIEPSKLIESAKRIFGDKMQTLWGEIGAVPEVNLRILNDGDVTDVGGVTIKAIATPGHASHHHVYYWDESVFGGDVAGVRIGNGPPIPPFVPPELHVESWLESIEKIRALKPNALYLPHFGLAPGSVPDHLDGLSERVRKWANWLRDKLRSGTDEQELISHFAKYEHDDLISGGASEHDVDDYETADPSYMAVPAAIRYWNKYHAVGRDNI